VLIPAIDLQGGRIVQLVQGERLALETKDVDLWIGRLQGFPKVQLIDLDAAKGAGCNDDLVSRICAALPCRVGGGIRNVDRARDALDRGAVKVIAGSALFAGGGVDLDFARRLSDGIGVARIIAAVDSRAGRVVVDGWRTQLPLTPIAAMRLLEPYVSEFLYTHVDREGLMQGTDIDAIAAIRGATSLAVTAAGGITTRDEIDALHRIGVDAVVGMALYTGRLTLDGGPHDAAPK
jgi:phosphoribosylformimino-5-aminoimidazole carboxamide ribotide isomerase